VVIAVKTNGTHCHNNRMAMGIRKKDTVWNTVCHVPVYHLQDPACLPRDSCGQGVVITVLHTSKLTTNGGVPPTKFPLTTGPPGSKNLSPRNINKPTHCRSLVAGWPDIVGICDASKYGVGGIVIGEQLAVPPTVFQLEWPREVQGSLILDKIQRAQSPTPI
jgi:hypothetical protein